MIEFDRAVHSEILDRLKNSTLHGYIIAYIEYVEKKLLEKSEYSLFEEFVNIGAQYVNSVSKKCQVDVESIDLKYLGKNIKGKDGVFRLEVVDKDGKAYYKDGTKLVFQRPITSFKPFTSKGALPHIKVPDKN